jgi:hypothetical protein
MAVSDSQKGVQRSPSGDGVSWFTFSRYTARRVGAAGSGAVKVPEKGS